MLEDMILCLLKQEYMPAEAEAALCQCVSTYKEFESEYSLSDSPQVKAEYLSCLRHLYNLVSKGMTSEIGTAKEIKDEIQRIEDEVSKAAGVLMPNPPLVMPLTLVGISLGAVIPMRIWWFFLYTGSKYIDISLLVYDQLE
ncbi:hypothetical protein Sango_0128700 [Sesamum angolense]|uniref:Uncharacterized protein n=1 Tax=Sesamum angolense TaxID=2727404 RepID=A0AAE1XEQ8_9LAMI|nr:hypothetical protein Sango_0128700 [Sesamum angolense]